jgi:NAD(P)-dependent dehydrogenase (short-subunit alcohol dehydrogenase family)
MALVTGASSGRAGGSARPHRRRLLGGRHEPQRGERRTARRGDVLDLDLTSDQPVRFPVEEAMERFGRIDVLVNNAGVGADGAGEESSTN